MSERMSNVIERRRTKAYFTFGRYQPPTVGHYSLIDQMKEQADATGADAYVFLSSTHKPGKPNSRWPLNVGTKYSIFKKRYPSPDADVRIITTSPTPFAAVDALKEKGYTDITIFLGSDQAFGSDTLGGRLSSGKDPIKVVGIGRNMNNGANTVTSMSGIRMREAATVSNLPRFAAGLGMTPNNASPYMSTLRQSMGLSPSGGSRRRRTTRQKKRRLTRRR